MPLVETFGPIVQEEARHILFFANYLAYRRATLSWIGLVLFQVKCSMAILEQVFARVAMAFATRRQNR
ncbi:MAG TPA: hypothetical protein VFE34_12080 [Dongiaceae bacterium]|nr:hypothetical protein [Dongiaceae bacterium]